MFITPVRNFHEPIKDPQKGPNALWAQMTNPPFPGKVVESSAVTRASGIAHINGNIVKPKIARSGPAACTAGSSPNGPPATSK
uniref:Uncharacterized protein n=1 Tax=Tanacetum cinerariifolium TaxID=118510 RepID=A0A699WV44_TANCI|nr:hypothetical protein [Tanacetum cinerariifolium]